MKKALFIFLLGVIFKLQIFGEEKPLSFWDKIKKYETELTDEEKIDAFSTVIPADLAIRFYSHYEIDGTLYGEIICYVDRIRWKGEPKVSEKKIINGLFENKYPMIKENSYRDDIKWFWLPAANTYYCVFIKISVGGKQSNWFSLGGMPNQFNFTTTDFSCENPDINTFKLEGIRVIYNCDYKVLTKYSEEIKYFMNNNKDKSPHLISAGAKYIDLNETVLNSIEYKWIKSAPGVSYSTNPDEYKDMGCIKILSDNITNNTLSKYIKQKQEQKQKDEQEKLQKEQEKLREEQQKKHKLFSELEKDKLNFYKDEKRCLRENLSIKKLGTVNKDDLNKLDVYCICSNEKNNSQISLDEFFQKANYFYQYSEPVNADIDKYTAFNLKNEIEGNLSTAERDKFNIIQIYIMLNIWSQRDGFSPAYIFPNENLNDFDTEEFFLLANFDQIQIDTDSDGYRLATEEDCTLISKNKKTLNVSLKKNSSEYVQKHCIVRTNINN